MSEPSFAEDLARIEITVGQVPPWRCPACGTPHPTAIELALHLMGCLP